MSGRTAADVWEELSGMNEAEHSRLLHFTAGYHPDAVLNALAAMRDYDAKRSARKVDQ